MSVSGDEARSGELIVALARYAAAHYRATEAQPARIRDRYERDDWEWALDEADGIHAQLQQRREELYLLLAEILPADVEPPSYPRTDDDWCALLERIPQLLRL